MSLLENLLGDQHNTAIGQIAGLLGIDENQAKNAMAQLMPVLAGHLQQHVTSGNGEAVAGVIEDAGDTKYINDPRTLAAHDTAQGNALTNSLLGGSGLADALSAKVAQSTGIDLSKIQAMLPMVSSLFAGSVAQHMANNGGGLQGILSMFTASGPLQGGGLFSTITNMLDSNHNGSALDEVENLIKSRLA